jgi:hypothetical protein
VVVGGDVLPPCKVVRVNAIEQGRLGSSPRIRPLSPTGGRQDSDKSSAHRWPSRHIKRKQLAISHFSSLPRDQ